MTAGVTSPRKAVVSVWYQGVNRGEFLGSAFFVSPSLLLTANHVLRCADGMGDAKTPFSLGSVEGATEVQISEKNLYRNVDQDVALIRLDMPIRDQPLAKLNFTEMTLEGTKVDFFAFNRFTKRRDEHKGHTIGTACDKRGVYVCDHQVLNGFSGGIAAQGNQVIGLITKRHRNDQQTLFIPLYRIKKWLDEENREIQDVVLDEYFNRKPKALEQDDEWKQYCRILEELAIFIDRPELAFSHISNFLKKRNNVKQPAIKACLCLWSSKQHEPSEFARGLAFLLTTRDTGIDPIKALEDNNVCVESISYDAVRARNYEQFSHNCNRQILDILKNPDRQDPSDQSDDESKKTDFDRIKGLMQNQMHAKVFCVQYQLASPKRNILDWFRPNQAEKLARQIMTRIMRWNREWELLNSTEFMPPVVLLFCIQLDEKTIKRVDGCFELAPIRTNDFKKWIEFAHEELAKENRVETRRLNKLERAFTRKIDSALGIEDLGAAVPYREFVQTIESLAEE